MAATEDTYDGSSVGTEIPYVQWFYNNATRAIVRREDNVNNVMKTKT